MRPLTDEETKLFFEKLVTFIGENIRRLLERADEPHVFRLHRDRVYYVSEAILKNATNFGRDKLMTLGTCFAKFTKSGKVRLQVQCLEHLARFAKHKVWVKANSEMSYLYGHHITKTGVGRITENVPQYAGVVVYSMNDVPLGYGVAAHTTANITALEPTAIVVLHQGDVGEYLRSEVELA